MITEKEYKEAVEKSREQTKIINQYHKEKKETFEKRMIENPIFTDDELVYSESSLCTCGHGLAYPKDCGPGHYWDCSATLKGLRDEDVPHTSALPFSMYSVKSENRNEDAGTTRGVFKPKKQE